MAECCPLKCRGGSSANGHISSMNDPSGDFSSLVFQARVGSVKLQSYIRDKWAPTLLNNVCQLMSNQLLSRWSLGTVLTRSEDHVPPYRVRERVHRSRRFRSARVGM